MRALILAAGLGERLRPLTLQRPKPALEFLNVPMLAFPYYWLNSLSLSEVTFNTHHLPAEIRHAAMHVVSPSTPMHFCHEEPILGSGGGIWNARFHLQGEKTFAVANGDAVLCLPEADSLEQMLKFHLTKGALATLLVCPLEGVGTRTPGVWLDPYNQAVNFGKVAKGDHLTCLHYASIMLCSDELWGHLPEGASNILYDVLEPLIADGEKVYAYNVPTMRWFETGNLKDYLTATRQCLEILRDKGPLSHHLLSLINQLAPRYSRASDFDNLRLIADSVELPASAQLRGFIVLGEEVQLGEGCVLENCVVLPGAKVPAQQSFANQILN